MRIAWATPFNVRSAVGRFSRSVAEELSRRGYELVILRLETGLELKLKQLDTSLEIISAADADVDRFDHVVINFGNHAPYHSQSIALLAQRAPLAIFHDAEMRDFEWGLRYRHGVHLPRLIGSKDDAANVDHDELVAPQAHPLLAALAGMSWAAVVHGPHYYRTVEANCPGPVKIIPLCYPDTGTPRAANPRRGRRRVIIFGVISEHKQPRRVMRALARIKETIGSVELHLAGSIEDSFRADLLREAGELEIDPPVIHGYVGDDRLQSLIEQANAVCCLRYPVTEGGSASLATALYRERPVIVSDVASYSMVPDKLICKVSYGEQVEDVAHALLHVFQHEAQAETRAKKARQWAEKSYSAAAYADEIEPLLRTIAPRQILAQIARELAPAIIAPDGRPITSAVADFAGVLDWMDGAQGPQNA